MSETKAMPELKRVEQARRLFYALSPERHMPESYLFCFTDRLVALPELRRAPAPFCNSAAVT